MPLSTRAGRAPRRHRAAWTAIPTASWGRESRCTAPATVPTRSTALVHGLVKLAIDVPSGKERIVGVAGPGDLIGALAPGQPALRESAEALSASVVVTVVPRQDAAAFEPALFRAAGDQLTRMTDALEDGELPVAARLARTLLRLGERFGQISEGGMVRITLPLTHENLAAMIGAARETTTATLGELRQLGLLEGTRGTYRFRREPLFEFAQRSALI